MKKTSIKLRYVALLDTETTSTDPPPKGKVIEVAVALFDVQHAQPVASFASLIRGDSNEAHAVNGIPPAMLPSARDPASVWQIVEQVIEPAQAVIAHNAAFDKQFTPDLKRPWVCSENDIKWPGRARGGSLVQLALSLGLGVASAHRAAADVDTLSRIFTRLAERGYDIGTLVTRAMRPKAVYHALVSYDDRHAAKDAGFRWDADGRVWWREMAIEDAKKLPFEVEVAR